MAIGGASAANTAAFAAAASTAAGRQALASSCISMFIQGNIAAGITAPGLFDGFNIDWEFPSAADTQNFTALLAEFRRQLDALSKTTGKRYVLSFDGPAGAQNYVNIDLKNAADQVDFITVDGYNYAGSWDTQTNHASPLFDSLQDPLYGQGLDIDATVGAYLKAGVPAKKYTMGCPSTEPDGPAFPMSTTACIKTRPDPRLCSWPTALDCVLIFPAPPPVATPSLPPASPPIPRSPISPRMDTAATSTGRELPSGCMMLHPERSTPTTIPLRRSSRCLHRFESSGGGLGGAYVWALKDDDANGSMVKTMANVLADSE